VAIVVLTSERFGTQIPNREFKFRSEESEFEAAGLTGPP
jgi:hypothetical protein